jgi:acyl CoA:acetate/3-ketoacid CoA transferase beta subunit
MYKHAAESFVAVAHAPNVAEKICTQVQDFCRSIATEGSNKFLTVEDGCAILRPANDGLFIRVSARDLVVFHGIQTIATPGDQAFSFIGATGFTGTAGEPRVVKGASNTFVYGDTTGDGSADISIHLDAAVTLSSGYFVL